MSEPLDAARDRPGLDVCPDCGTPKSAWATGLSMGGTREQAKAIYEARDRPGPVNYLQDLRAVLIEWLETTNIVPDGAYLDTTDVMIFERALAVHGLGLAQQREGAGE